MKQLQAEPRESEHAVKCELAAEVLRSFGTLRLGVTGLSMLPAIWPGDTLLIDWCELNEVAPGDIVLFARGGKLVAHRVVCKRGTGENAHAISRGDSMLLPDSPVSRTELLGKVRQVLRAGEFLKPRTERGFGTRMISQLVQRCGWMARAAAFAHSIPRRVWRRETLYKS